MGVLTIGVLGAVEARRDGAPLPVPTGKTTELLARLAVDAGLPVRVDAILEDLWGEPTARNTLQAKVSQLRKALGDRDLVRALDGAYLLAVDPTSVDAVRALGLAVSAERARAAGDPAGALRDASAGAGLFRGEVLPAAGDWAAPHRTRLGEARWSLVETMVAARVDLGAGAEVVAELEGLVAEQPLREGLWAALVTALYRSGRQGEALEACARARRHLLEELGVDPGPTLRRLELEVLEQSPDLGGARRERELSRPGNVTAAPQPLVGRDADLTLVEELVRDRRLVTLAGPAGIGKTRLATEVAARAAYPGGAWLVRLDAVDATADVLQIVAETMQVTGGPAALRERLEGADTLLVLDNCEHVVAQVAAAVTELLESARGPSVLATSQQPLGLETEVVHPLSPLAPEDSLRLFELRAQRDRRGFALDPEQQPVVADVCAALDHLPLAIELAAARGRSLPVGEIARRLDDRFALLRDPGSNEAPRRRALETAIGWSYELLFPDDQRGLWALSCFADGATLGALEAVLTALDVPHASVLDTLTRLVDRSLVSLDVGAGVEPRYRLLDSVRLFAAARLQESGESAAAVSAYVDWYAHRAAWCHTHVRTAAQPECLAFARGERADIDAVLSWSHEHAPETGAAIGLGLAWTWVVLGDGTAGAARVRAAVADAPSPADRARGGLTAAWLEAATGDLALAERDLEAAAALVARLDEADLTADVHWHRAFLAIQQGRADVVRSESAAALASYRSAGDDWSVAAALLLAAYGALMVGDVPSAHAAAGEAVALLTPLSDAWGLVHAQGILGGVAQAEGRLGDAATAFESAAAAAARLGFVGQAALHRASWARCLARAGDPGARAAYDEALLGATAVADGRLAASVRLHLARLLRSEGSTDRAAELLATNTRWYAAAGGGDLALLNRVETASLAGAPVALESALAEARAGQDVESVVSALDGLARVAAASGDVATARGLLAEADALMGGAPYLIDHTDRYDARAARILLG